MGGMGGHPMMNNGGDQVKTYYQDKDGDLDEDKRGVDQPVPKYGFFKKSLDPLNTACVMVK